MFTVRRSFLRRRDSAPVSDGQVPGVRHPVGTVAPERINPASSVPRRSQTSSRSCAATAPTSGARGQPPHAPTHADSKQRVFTPLRPHLRVHAAERTFTNAASHAVGPDDGQGIASDLEPLDGASASPRQRHRPHAGSPADVTTGAAETQQLQQAVGPSTTTDGEPSHEEAGMRSDASRSWAGAAAGAGSAAVCAEAPPTRTRGTASAAMRALVPRVRRLAWLLPLALLLAPLLTSRLGLQTSAGAVWHRGGLSAHDAATTAARVVRALSGTDPEGGAGVPPPSEQPLPPGGSPDGWEPDAAVRVVTLVPRGLASPFKTTWGELAAHTATRLSYTDASFQMRVFHEEDLEVAGSTARDALLAALSDGCQLLMGVSLQRPSAVEWLASSAVQAALPPSAMFLESSDQLVTLSRLPCGWSPSQPSPSGLLDGLLAAVPFTPQAKARRAAELYGTIAELLSRHNSDDFLFVYLVLINEYVTNVDDVSMTTKGFDLESIYCMVTKCGRQVLDCVQDTVCKAGLDCLQACSFNDQVCQYRCITTYETPKFGAFSLCILQLNNCRNLDAKPPLMPDVQPMASFRGSALTHDLAEDLFIGWMHPEAVFGDADGGATQASALPYSWLVAAGKNPAYDYFPAQHQLFYRGKAKGAFWYEPVFKVITLRGEQVWRRRRYRVRRGAVPGTFHFSVLDNGVTSNEYWRIVDCDEDLEWCLFYYSGAAATAGLSYSGAVLGTRDGAMPSGADAMARVQAALEVSGIKTWELHQVDNSDLAGAPL